MNFVSELYRLLNYKPPHNPQELAKLMDDAANNTITAAIKGVEISDVLDYKQVGLITAAMHWNYSGTVRQAAQSGAVTRGR